MSRTIPNFEYRRRVFNAALLESLHKPYFEALGLTESLSSEPAEDIDEGVKDTVSGLAARVKERMQKKAKDEGASQPELKSADAAPTNPDGSEKKITKTEKPLNSCGGEDLSLCESMFNSYFTEELKLNESTIDQTIARLKGSNQYVIEAAEEAKVIADQHAEDARENKEEHKDDEEISLTPEDHEVLDQLFHSKGPGPQIEQIRDATVKALLAEDKKSQEVRDALNLANSRVGAGDTNAFKDTAARLEMVGPTSLMGAIMNNMSRAAIKSVNEAGNFTSVGDAMAENADMIKTRSVMLYAIMETGNQLEITHMSNRDVERLANNIFYQK